MGAGAAAQRRSTQRAGMASSCLLMSCKQCWTGSRRYCALRTVSDLVSVSDPLSVSGLVLYQYRASYHHNSIGPRIISPRVQDRVEHPQPA